MRSLQLLRHAAILTALLTSTLLTTGRSPGSAQGFAQTNLVSDLPGMALLTDPDLINPWGWSTSAASPFWVSNAGRGNSTLYSVTYPDGPRVTKSGLVVTIPPATGGTQGAPSGQLFNTTTNFVVSQGGSSAPASFIFAGLDGTISGWNTNVPSSGSTQAIRTVDNPGTAVYTGLALGNNNAGNFLYAANRISGRVDVFNSSFAPTTLAGTFSDPGLPSGARPFNVVNLGGKLYVAYTGPGGGLIDTFDTSGNFLQRLVTGGPLSSPWGMTLAPAGYGPFGNDLLVGDFNGGNPANGDGYINAFDPDTGAFRGRLTDEAGAPLSIDGLWQIGFGNGGNGGRRDFLYFAAGIQNEQHGLFGSVAATPEPGTLSLLGASLIPALLYTRCRRKRR